jgi:hypothetical protein
MFLYIVIGQNPNKSNSKKLTLFNLIWCDVRIYLCQKKSRNILKMQIYSKNDRNDF